MTNKIKEQLIVKMYGGSKLYGLVTPQSDTDILGIFLPNKEDLILQKAPEECNLDNQGCDSCTVSKGTAWCSTDNHGVNCGLFEKDKKDYIEEKYFSLHRFLELCYNGNPMALEMLGSEKENIIPTSQPVDKERRYVEKGYDCHNCMSNCGSCGGSEWIVVNEPISLKYWNFLVKNRKKFFTKDLKGFLGYAKSQAHLYSRKGDRVVLLEDLLKWFRTYGVLGDMSATKMNQALNGELIRDWGEQYGDNVKFIAEYGNQNIQALEICGKYFPLSITMKEAIARLEKMRDRYGKRAEEASTNKADFKAISHTYRVIYEVMMIARTGDLKFPFDEDIKNKIMDVKLGKVAVEKCYDELEELVKEAEELIQKSDLPEVISNETRKFFDSWLLNLYE